MSRAVTKEEAITNLARAYWLLHALNVDSIWIPFIESTLRRHYGDAEFSKLIADEDERQSGLLRNFRAAQGKQT